MRERIDCAVLTTQCSHGWIGDCSGVQAAGRVYLEALAPDVQASDPDSARELARRAMELRRYDACIIAVSESNLSWARTSLRLAQGELITPVLALVQGLKAAALQDLYQQGLDDFMRYPICFEELRGRVQHVLDVRRHATWPTEAVSTLGEQLPGAPGRGRFGCLAQAGSEEDLCSTILERTGLELDAFAAASASRCATSKESFRSAKSKIIERFERAYINAALGRHSGNITMAARAAQKHRRAFWALMRKYQIDAAPYREDAPRKQ